MTDSPDLASSEDQDQAWAAFDDAPEAATEFSGGDDEFFNEKSAVCDSEDEWNDFEFASTPQTAVDPESAFHKAEEPICVEQSTETNAEIPPNTTLSMEALLCDLDIILNSCIMHTVRPSVEEPFRDEDTRLDTNNDEVASSASICSDNLRLSLLADLLGESGDAIVDNKSEENNSCDPMAGEAGAVWSSLRLIEEAAALKYQWGEARTYERHVCALRMDLRLAKIRNPKLPAFAWQLSTAALTPQKSVGPTSSGGNSSPSVVTAVEQKLGNDDCGVADRHSTIQPPKSSGSNNLSSGPSNGIALAPLEFDWSSSGLSNPLCEGVVDSGSMDVDYYSSCKPVVSSSLSDYGVSSAMVNADVADTWKSDLKLLGLMTDDDSTTTSDSPVKEISHSMATTGKTNAAGVNLLEKLMTSNHRTTSNMFGVSSPASALSDDARRLLDTLPDLSFMLSPVLMFPLREDCGRLDGSDDVQL